MKQIEITVSPDGATKVETRGFTGTECRQASKFVETALGNATTIQLTSEYFQTAESQQSQSLQTRGENDNN